jgi:uncharacterized integral membrane protein
MRKLVNTVVFLGVVLAGLLLPAAANAASMVEYASAATAIEYGL